MSQSSTSQSPLAIARKADFGWEPSEQAHSEQAASEAGQTPRLLVKRAAIQSAKHSAKHARPAPGKLERVRSSWSLRKTIIGGAVAGLLLAAGRVDRVAAGLALVALLTTMRVLRIRNHRTARRAGLVAGAGATILGMLAAFALPVFALKTDPLIVNLPSEAAPSSPPSKQVLPDVEERPSWVSPQPTTTIPLEA
jgi:hypothetical protein